MCIYIHDIGSVRLFALHRDVRSSLDCVPEVSGPLMLCAWVVFLFERLNSTPESLG